MHTAIVMGGGLALLVACALLGHAFGGMPGALTGIKAFIPIWFVLAAINMWIGVRTAGYSVADEAPVFLAIFGVLAVIAGLLWWKLS